MVDGEINLDEREELESEDGKHYTQGRGELDLEGRREELESKDGDMNVDERGKLE